MSQNISVQSEEEMLSLQASPGDYVTRTDIGRRFMLTQEPASDINNWLLILFPSYVNSINGMDNVVSITTDTIPEADNLYFTEDRANKVFDDKIKDVGLEDFAGNEKIITEDNVLTINCGNSVSSFPDIEDNEENHLPPGTVPQHIHDIADIKKLDETIDLSVKNKVDKDLEDIRSEISKASEEILKKVSSDIKNNTIVLPEASSDKKGILKLYSQDSIKNNDKEIKDGTMDVSTILSCLEEYENMFSDIISKNTFPIGFMYFSFNRPEDEAGSIPLNGMEYSKSLYKDLWEWAKSSKRVISLDQYDEKDRNNNGNVPYFADCGNDKFRVPRIKTYTIGTDSADSIGEYIEAGLPAHVHEIATALKSKENASGKPAFDWNASNNSPTSEITNIVSGTPIGNSVYGKSDTVQPESLVGMWYIRAYGTVINKGVMDLDRVLKDYTYFKHDIETMLKALPKRYITKTYHYKESWYEIYNDGWVRQGGKVHLKEMKTKQTFRLNKAFLDTDYTCICQESTKTYYKKCEYINAVSVFPEDTESLNFINGSYETEVYWIAEGQGLIEK